MRRFPAAVAPGGPAGRGATRLRLALAGVAAVALVAALASAGCAGTKGGGDAPAAGRTPGDDEVRLVVSRDFGAEIMRDVVVPASDGLDVLRLLAENAEVDTGYGGQFVNGIDGLESSFGAVSTKDAADWFYWVDGVLADLGAADWKLRGGETVWWDYHRWADAMVVPAALHAFPRPYSSGPLAVTAAVDAAGLGDWAETSGLELEPRRDLEGGPPGGGLVLATAAEAAATPWLGEMLDGARSGVEFVRVDEETLCLLALGGQAGPTATALAQPVTNPDDPERPFLLVLGASRADLEAFIPRLTPEALNAAVGVALVDGDLVHLPWQSR